MTSTVPRTTTDQIWLVTGSSRGLGRALVASALAAGDRVVATARRPEQLAAFVEQYGDRVLPLALDVTDGARARSAVEQAVARFGRIDVLVNNAGYSDVSPIETTSDEHFRTQFETNFWGVYNLSKAAIAPLRAQGGGLIIQLSSIGGRVGGSPGIASYQAAKFAVDGFSRVLAAETAPFGIAVLVVEPSGFATDWAGSSMTVHDIPAEYESTVGFMNARMRQHGTPPGDPARAAEILVRIAHRRSEAGGELPTHLLLGVNAVEMAIDYSRRQLAEAEAWAQVGRSADVTEPYPVELPAGSARDH